MKASKEIKKWLSKLRKRHGKQNGVIGIGCLDSPYHEIELSKRSKAVKKLRQTNPMEEE